MPDLRELAMPRYVIDLSRRAARSEALTGGKASTLAYLKKKGFRIPAGFVISTAVFKSFLRGYPGKDASPGRRADPGRITDAIIRYLLTADLPGRAEKEILSAFRKLGRPVAVRSSLVGEDGVHASCAGQLDSFLGIGDASELIDALRRCYASLFGERWLSYLGDRGNRIGGDATGYPSLAVLVQSMIDARSGGVAFSADPDTGRFCVIIEAVRGSPESVASGRASPDRYVLDSRGVLAEQVVSDEGPPVLDEGQIVELGSMVREISRERGLPQDVEWALNESGFFVLQSRPITPLAGKNIYSRKLAADMAPGLVKPLYWSTNVTGMAQNVFGRLFGEILGRDAVDGYELVKCIHSRVYANVTAFAKLLGRIGMPVNLFEVLARDEAAVHKRPDITPRLIGSLGRLALVVLRHGWCRRKAETFMIYRDRVLEPFRRTDWSSASQTHLLDAIHSLRAVHGRTQWFMWLTAVSMMIRNKLMARSIGRHAPNVSPRDLLAGYENLKSLEPNRAMRTIAEAIERIDPELLPSLAGASDSSIRERVGKADGGGEVIALFDGFMDRYGHLSASGTDFTVPPWRERPDLIWRSIGDVLDGPAAAERVDARDIREKAVSLVLGQVSWPRKIIFRWLLDGTTTYLSLRERLSFCMSEDAYQMRRVYLAMGENLVAGGVLRQAEDVFFLMFDELENLLEGRLDPLIPRERAQTRRAAIKEDAGIEIADIVCGDTPAVLSSAFPEDIDYIAGIPGSAGLVQGRARIVTDPYEAKTGFGGDDILVVPFMDVGWTPLFPRVGGIVAETGGQLSHSAIVAREYRVPAVVGVRRATRVIEEGQPITVDGNRGRVYLKHLT
jgi:pyruvate,water dikinase